MSNVIQISDRPIVLCALYGDLLEASCNFVIVIIVIVVIVAVILIVTTPTTYPPLSPSRHLPSPPSAKKWDDYVIFRG